MRVINGSNNDLLSFWRQAITETNACTLSLGSYETKYIDISIKISYFHHKRYIWCRLHNVGILCQAFDEQDDIISAIFRSVLHLQLVYHVVRLITKNMDCQNDDIWCSYWRYKNQINNSHSIAVHNTFQYNMVSFPEQNDKGNA